MITHHCAVCGEQVSEFCADHPGAMVDSVVSSESEPTDAGTYCVICDRDREPGEAGETRSGDWYCPDCLATEPCEKCDGEHHHAAPCATCAVCRWSAEPCLGWGKRADGAWICPCCQGCEGAVYTFDGECPSTMAEFLAANEGLDCDDIRGVAMLAVGETYVLGGGAAATCEIRRVK